MQIALMTWLKHFLTQRLWPDHWPWGDYSQIIQKKLVVRSSKRCLQCFLARILWSLHTWHNNESTLHQARFQGWHLESHRPNFHERIPRFLLRSHQACTPLCWGNVIWNSVHWPDRHLFSICKFPRVRDPQGSFTRFLLCWTWWPFGGPQQLWMQKKSLSRHPTRNSDGNFPQRTGAKANVCYWLLEGNHKTTAISELWEAHKDVCWPETNI